MIAPGLSVQRLCERRTQCSVGFRFVAIVPLLAAATLLALPFWLPKALRLSVRWARHHWR